jgi:hypothetical protein
MQVDEIPTDSEFIYVVCTVNKKTFVISCGDGTQRVKWLGHVAIARWDEANNQGWKWLGAPTKMMLGLDELDLGSVIKDVLQTGDKVTITTSLDPFETR